MINTHLLEISLSRTYFYGSKGVQAIEVLPYNMYMDYKKLTALIPAYPTKMKNILPESYMNIAVTAYFWYM